MNWDIHIEILYENGIASMFVTATFMTVVLGNQNIPVLINNMQLIITWSTANASVVHAKN